MGPLHLANFAVANLTCTKGILNLCAFTRLKSEVEPSSSTCASSKICLGSVLE